MNSATFSAKQRQAMRFVRSKAFATWVNNPGVVDAFRNYFSVRNPGFTSNHWVFVEQGVSLTLSTEGLSLEPHDIQELRDAYERAGVIELGAYPSDL